MVGRETLLGVLCERRELYYHKMYIRPATTAIDITMMGPSGELPAASFALLVV